MSWPPPIAYSLGQAIERLPPRAQAKLADLEGQANDAVALARVLQDRIRKQESKCAEIAHRRDRAIATRNAVATAELDRELQAAVASLDRLRRDLNTRNAVAANTAQVLGVLRNFVAALFSGLTEMQPPPPPAQVAWQPREDEDLLTALERVRREVGAAGSEIARIRAAPLPLKELRDQISREVDRMAALGAPRIVMKTAVEVAIAWPDLPPPGVAMTEPVYSPGSASRMLCWLFADRVKAELTADLPADGPNAIPAADRPAKLREIEARLHGWEVAEERLVMRALEQGLDVARRQAASCWAVLFTADEQEAVAEAAE